MTSQKKSSTNAPKVLKNAPVKDMTTKPAKVAKAKDTSMAEKPKYQSLKAKNKGRNTAPDSSYYMELQREAHALDKTASLLNYILYVAKKFRGKSPEPFDQFMDPYCSQHTWDRKTYEGDNQFPHLILWAKMSIIDHWAFPFKGASEEEAEETIGGMQNYETAYDYGVDIRFLPNNLKYDDGTPFDWSKCNDEYVSYLETLVATYHECKLYKFKKFKMPNCKCFF